MKVPFVLCEALLWCPIVNSAEQWWAMTAPTQWQLHLASRIISAGTFAARRCSDAQCDADISDYRILLLICYVISNTQGRFSFSYWASVSNVRPEAFISETVEGLLKLEDGGINWVLVWLTLE